MNINTPFIGRQEKIDILNKALLSPEAEMVAVIGRRSVVKNKSA